MINLLIITHIFFQKQIKIPTFSCLTYFDRGGNKILFIHGQKIDSTPQLLLHYHQNHFLGNSEGF